MAVVLGVHVGDGRAHLQGPRRGVARRRGGEVHRELARHVGRGGEAGLGGAHRHRHAGTGDVGRVRRNGHRPGRRGGVGRGGGQLRPAHCHRHRHARLRAGITRDREPVRMLGDVDRVVAGDGVEVQREGPGRLHGDGEVGGGLVVVVGARGGGGDDALAHPGQGHRAGGRVDRAHLGGRRRVQQGGLDSGGGRDGRGRISEGHRGRGVAEVRQLLVTLGHHGEGDRHVGGVAGGVGHRHGGGRGGGVGGVRGAADVAGAGVDAQPRGQARCAIGGDVGSGGDRRHGADGHAHLQGGRRGVARRGGGQVHRELARHVARGGEAGLGGAHRYGHAGTGDVGRIRRDGHRPGRRGGGCGEFHPAHGHRHRHASLGAGVARDREPGRLLGEVDRVVAGNGSRFRARVPSACTVTVAVAVAWL